MSIFLITAPSGAGKTTIADIIAKQGNWNECISHTTRPMREGEVEGKTYYFTDIENFEDAYSMGEFAERVTYDGQYYGITHSEISRVLDAGKHVYIIVEYEGYKQVKELYPEAIGIFLYMTQEECVQNMLSRGDSTNGVEKRSSTYEREMKNRWNYDYVIRNVKNKQSATVSIINAIISCY